MVGLLNNIGTVIEITRKGSSTVKYTGDINSWSESGFETEYSATSTFGTTFISRSPTKSGNIKFDFKFKDYSTNSLDSLLGMNKAKNTSWFELTDSKQTAKKITIKFSNDTNNYIMTFYNVFAVKTKTDGSVDKLPTASIEFMVPPFDEGGNSNFYQSDTLSDETTWDNTMGWS